MPNQEYQSLFGADEQTVTEALERTLSLGERWKLALGARAVPRRRGAS